MGLLRIGAENEGAAIGELEVSDLQFGALAAAMSDKEPAVRLAVIASDHEQPVPIFQQLAGGHPSGRDDVREISAVAAQRRGVAGRAWDRHQSRDRPVLVEPIWPNVRRRDPQDTRGARARLSSVALAFG